MQSSVEGWNCGLLALGKVDKVFYKKINILQYSLVV